MCKGCTRRVFLFSAATTLGSVRAWPMQQIQHYCAWNAAALQNFRTYSSSGNDNIDAALIAELKKILNIIPINPGFQYIDDVSPNAFAVPENVVRGTQGTVYIGLRLINGEFNNDAYGGVAVAGICAHECGHIYQFQNGYMEALAGQTALLVELHADYIAGLYLGRDRSHSREHVEVFSHSLFSKGDYDFNKPQHHGTPDQRVRAMRQGYDLGTTDTDFATAVRQGAAFVRQL
jgi:hypothetical protein